MTEPSTLNEHITVSELLPWYVNETLGTAELERVRTHLGDCRDCRDDVTFLGRIRNSVRDDTPIPLVPEPRFTNLLGRLAGLQDSHTRSRRRLYLATAAALAIAVAVFSLPRDGKQLSESGTPTFEVQSAANPAQAMEYTLDVTFTSAADEQTIRSTLHGLDVSNIVVGADARQYRVTISLPDRTLASLQGILSQFEESPAIESIQVLGARPSED